MSDGLNTLLVGIDAACFPVLVPQFRTDDLPTLQRLFETSGELESQIPPWTASAWPSVYTGMNPGKHGVFDFLSFDGYDWDVVSSTHVRRRFLWELLDLHGYRSVVVNAPVTAPPRPFDGALVPGYMAPESPACHPEGLLDDIEAAIGTYEVYGDADSATDRVRSRGEAFRYLADRFDPAFGFLQFQWTDTICHERPGDTDALGAVYRAVDEQIAETLDACEPRNVVVVSDHGIGPYSGFEFRVNEFLAEHGYVTVRRGGDGMPTWADTRDTRLRQGAETTRPTARLLDRLAASAATDGLTSQRLGSLFEAMGLRSFVLDHVPTSTVSAATEQVDFARSRAYMRSRTECGVRLNVEGREPDGVVPQSAYDDERRAIIELLRDATCPDGSPVFEAVVPREEVLYGPEAHRAVDIVTVPTGFDQFLSARLGGGVFDQPSEPWNHKRMGVIAARGPDIDESASLANASLFDVAPTVLATFGVPADADMDGRTLPIVDDAGEREYPAHETDAPTESAPETVAQRLSDLGYIE